MVSESVREKTGRMRDLLEISGLTSISYWCGYMVMAAIYAAIMCGLMTITLSLGGLNAISDISRMPYVELMFFCTMAIVAQSLAIGNLFEKVEYYALPVFLFHVGISVGGIFIANNEYLTVNAKNTLGVLSPGFALSNGIWAIENFQHKYKGIAIDMQFIDDAKHIPSVNDSCVMCILGVLVWIFVAWGYPFDWISSGTNNEGANVEEDIFPYPCDHEEMELRMEKNKRNGQHSQHSVVDSNTIARSMEEEEDDADAAGPPLLECRFVIRCL